MAFQLLSGSEEDLAGAAQVLQPAMATDDQWGLLMKNVTVEDELAFLREFFAMRYAVGDRKLFVLKEAATGYVPFRIIFIFSTM